MLKKDLYLKIYRRFCKMHNLSINKEAVDDILDGSRLVFGIGPRYCPEYKDEWFNLILPLFFQDADYVLDKMKIFRVKEWNLADIIYALNRGSVTDYLYSVCGCSYSISEFFFHYKGALNKKFES